MPYPSTENPNGANRGMLANITLLVVINIFLIGLRDEVIEYVFLEYARKCNTFFSVLRSVIPVLVEEW